MRNIFHGYKQNVISTIVDTITTLNNYEGYKPNVISTIVDDKYREHDYFGL